MIDYFVEKSKEIKKELFQLKKILKEIPAQRNIICRIEEFRDLDSKFIYKPRFIPQFKLIDKPLKSHFNKLLADINNYLKEYSPDEFKNLEHIFKGDLYNKKSITFLLENDVWATDEVYGDYLVEKFKDHYEVFYYRWKRKIKQLENQDLLTEITNYIIKDAIIQMQTQFDKIWEYLDVEIKKSLQNYESLKNRYASFKKDITLEEMLEEGKKILNINTFLSTFYIGYVLEHLLRIKLNKLKDHMGLGWLIYLSKRKNILTKFEAKICSKIKDAYNKTKHKMDYRVETERLSHLYDKFFIILAKLD
ncbi:MAG: hypothetical protein KJI71_02185 [Patescibacteria group bacterium]|nr:hypothetical protein [Patescibacteria group bacterium]